MQLSNEIITILEYLCDKLGIAVDWTNQNILPYLQQLTEKFIRWEMCTSIAWIVIAVVLTSIIFIAVYFFEKNYCDITYGGLWIVFAAVAAFCFGIIGFQVFDIIECNVFPEKVLYDYITNHIKGG